MQQQFNTIITTTSTHSNNNNYSKLYTKYICIQKQTTPISISIKIITANCIPNTFAYRPTTPTCIPITKQQQIADQLHVHVWVTTQTRIPTTKQ